MTRGEALQLAGLLGLLWRGQEVTPETAQLWWEAGLADIDLRRAVEGLKVLARSSPFLPALSEIIDAAGHAARGERENRPRVVEGSGVPPPPGMRAELIRRGILPPDPPEAPAVEASG
jgi:hypothetical protein